MFRSLIILSCCALVSCRSGEVCNKTDKIVEQTSSIIVGDWHSTEPFRISRILVEQINTNVMRVSLYGNNATSWGRLYFLSGNSFAWKKQTSHFDYTINCQPDGDRLLVRHISQATGYGVGKPQYSFDRTTFFER